MTSPAHLETDYLVVDSPYELANWRPLVQWVLAIPHLVLATAIGSLVRLVFLIYWLMLVFTGTLNRGLYGVMVMYERYNQRATGYFLGFSERFPPFDFDLEPDDNEAYPPIKLTLLDPPETADRKAALNVFLAIPHYLVLAVIGIAAAVLALIAWFIVLFTGRWPAGMRDFLVRYGNYYYRVWSYVTMVQPGYPRFGL